ncbi:uncharacterized protein LOC115992209 [Quercus lobata]|uniref:SNRNP25 ubiquitin-like domain-containing protein n=1 Tax=Quercus lobata TaxID=97700 RepID=A0A7N2LQG6_QUELO|nr:uncharacterized protein LOC115992209 [Quercus lobata]
MRSRSRSRRSISEEEEEESLSSSSSESSNGNITPTSNDDVVANSSGLFLRYHQYHKLPQPFFLKLSVLKLDSSLFDVFVARNATVAELKQAIEEVFASSADEISWCHVWGHFCLCYNGQKLINDKTCLQNFGIKDGDQLQFIRHMSVQYSPLRKRPSNKSVACKQQSLEMELVDFDVRSLSGSDSHEEISSDDSDNNENQDSSKYSDENQEEVPLLEFKLAKFLRRWLSSSRSRSLLKNGSEGRSAGTGFPLHCLGGVPRFNAKDKLM